MKAIRFRRLLVPHDFSAHATAALKTAAALAADHGGRLVVQHVVVPFYVPADLPFGMAADALPSPASFVPEQTQALKKLVEKALGRNAVPVTYRVEVGDPTHCILDASEGCDLIVMATAGRTGLSHLLIGSVAEKVVRHSTVPVLTIRPKGAKRPAGKRRRG